MTDNWQAKLEKINTQSGWSTEKKYAFLQGVQACIVALKPHEVILERLTRHITIVGCDNDECEQELKKFRFWSRK